ncbi:MAG TPA: GntR family transcriptional regulator [Burkholderiaceae bacterium]|nr:GntR family transcriptional regulator [Burkholderiaceae bacterium]
MKTRLGHRTLSAAIVEELRRAILDGTYPAGEQLRQDALAASFQVSRIPIREALIQLEAEGLVRIEPHKGAIVSAFSLEEIDDVFDLRVLLEPRMLAQSAPLLGPEDFAEISALDAAFADAIAAQDVAQWGHLNARYHLALYRHARQPRTLAIVTTLLQTSDRFTRLQMNRAPALSRAEKEHRHLLRLCREGKVPEACEYLADHVERVRQDLHALLRRDAQASARRQAQAAVAAKPSHPAPPAPPPARRRT